MEADQDFTDCTIYMSYNPCETDFFVCTLTEEGDYGLETVECNEDFEDGDFWAMMRVEDFWMERELYDFYHFWEEYHSGDQNDYDDYLDCDWIETMAECSDFDFIMRHETENNELFAGCSISMSFSPCETDYFMCEAIDYYNGEA